MAACYLITGNDEAAIREKARACVASLVGPEPDDLTLEVCRETDDRDAATALNDLLGAVLTPSMFGGPKTIWLQDFSAFADEGRDSPVGKGLTQLVGLIGEGLPDDVSLVLSGPGADAKRKLCRAAKKHGELHNCRKLDLQNRRWSQEVQALIHEKATAKGLQLAPGVIGYLVETIGVDTARIDPELEKVLCFAGERPTLEQVSQVCAGSREADAFALNTAFGRRSLEDAYAAIARFMSHSRDPEGETIRLVRMTATFFKGLLEARLLMQHLRARPEALADRLTRLSPEEEEQLGENGLAGRHPYFVKLRAEEANRYRPPEILRALSLLAETDRLLVSSGLPRRLLLETLALRIIC